MGMLLSEKLDYLREYGTVTNSGRDSISRKLKKMLDLMITFSPILWIIFFLMLTVLTSFLGGV